MHRWLIGCCCFVTSLSASLIEIGADALYWRDVSNGFLYAIDTGTSDLAHFAVPKYDWGIAVWGRLNQCSSPLFIRGRYVHFDSTVRSQASEPPGGGLEGLFRPLLVVAEQLLQATARLKVEYRGGTVDLGFLCSANPCLQVELFGGARYANLFYRLQVDYLIQGGTNERALEFASFRGIGPHLGIGCEWNPFSYGLATGFQLFGHIAFAAIIGNNRLRLSADNGFLAFSNSQTYPSRLAIHPAVDLRIGLSYSVDICHVTFSGEIGYELDYYFSVFDKIDNTTRAGVPTGPGFSDGFGGPFFGLSIAY